MGALLTEERANDELQLLRLHLRRWVVTRCGGTDEVPPAARLELVEELRENSVGELTLAEFR